MSNLQTSPPRQRCEQRMDAMQAPNAGRFHAPQSISSPRIHEKNPRSLRPDRWGRQGNDAARTLGPSAAGNPRFIPSSQNKHRASDKPQLRSKQPQATRPFDGTARATILRAGINVYHTLRKRHAAFDSPETGRRMTVNADLSLYGLPCLKDEGRSANSANRPSYPKRQSVNGMPRLKHSAFNTLKPSITRLPVCQIAQRFLRILKNNRRLQTAYLFSRTIPSTPADNVCDRWSPRPLHPTPSRMYRPQIPFLQLHSERRSYLTANYIVQKRNGTGKASQRSYVRHSPDRIIGLSAATTISVTPTAACPEIQTPRIFQPQTLKKNSLIKTKKRERNHSPPRFHT